MSAGGIVTGATVSHDLARLAPKFRAAVEATLTGCAELGLDAMVFEAYRSPELATVYFKRGRPPTTEYPRPVTNAPSNEFTWHGYGLAVDVISKAKEWGAGDEWFHAMADVAKMHGLKWGGDWKMRDTPHIQWAACRASPSDHARELLRAQGMPAVWAAVGAG